MEIHAALSAQKKSKSRQMFYSLLTLLLLLCTVRYVLSVNIPQFCFLAVAGLMLLAGDEDEIIATCICCIPLYGFFESIFAVLFGIVCYVAKKQNSIKVNYSVILVLLMMLWELLHCFAPGFGIVKFGGQCVPWILLMILMCSPGYTCDYGFIVRSFAFSITFVCLTLVLRILYSAGFQIATTLVMMQRLGIEAEEAIVKINPNSLGVLCVLAISGLMQLRVAKQRRKGDMVYIIALLLFGIMTASKTFFVCLLFAVLLLFCAVKGDLGNKIRYGIGIIFVGLIVLGIGYLLIPSVVKNFFARFYEKDFTTGRMELMGIFHQFIVSNLKILLFGIGLQDFHADVGRLCPQAFNSPHNCIQETIIAWGIPGLLLLAVLWYEMILHSRKCNGRQRLINYIPFLVILLKSQAGQILNSEHTMLSFGFAYLSMCTDLSGEISVQKLNPVAEKHDGGMDLWRVVRFFWKKKVVLIVLSLACAFMGYGITKEFVAPKYESTVLLYVNNSNISASNVVDAISNGDIVASRKLLSTYRTVLQSRQTINEVIGLSGISETYDEVRGMIVADSANGTEVLKIVVTHTDPGKAERIANAIAEVLPRRIAEIIDGTSTKVIDYAIAATDPSSPSKAINTMIGCMMGCIAGAAVLLCFAMRETTISDLDLTELFPYPVLARIPTLEDARPRSLQRLVKYYNSDIGGVQWKKRRRRETYRKI